MEPLITITEFSNHSVSSKLLYLDAFNNIHKFYDMGGPDPPNYWDLESPYQKIQCFVQASAKSGYALKVFLKSNMISKEEQDKWMNRQVQEAITGKNFSPPKFAYLFYAFFTKAGAEVVFSNEADSEDTIASHAQHDNASIISSQRDFFLYVDRKYEIYEDFQIDSNGILHLTPHCNPIKKESESSRKILSPPPKTTGLDSTLLKWTMTNILFFGCLLLY